MNYTIWSVTVSVGELMISFEMTTGTTKPTNREIWYIVNHYLGDIQCDKKIISVNPKTEPVEQEETTNAWRAIVKDGAGREYELLGEGERIPCTTDIWQLLGDKYGSLSCLFRNIVSIQRALNPPSKEHKYWTVKFEMADKSVHTTIIYYPANYGSPPASACWMALFNEQKVSLGHFLHILDVNEFVEKEFVKGEEEPSQEEKFKSLLQDFIKSVEGLLN